METLGDRLDDLWQVLLHMRANGHEEYAELDEAERGCFAELVRKGALFAYVEDCKSAVLATGFDLPDFVINVLCAGRVQVGEPMVPRDAQAIENALRFLYAARLRELSRGQGRIADADAGGGVEVMEPAKLRKLVGVDDQRTLNKLIEGGTVRAKRIGLRKFEVPRETINRFRKPH